MRWTSFVTGTLQGGGSSSDPAHLGQVLEALRAELKVPDEFPREVVVEARAAAGEAALPTRDETAVPFLTVAPPGTGDLDQAMHLERAGQGYRVRYAVADLSAFVVPGGEVDQESFRRGRDIWLTRGGGPGVAERRAPLYPGPLRDAASLLPGQVRPAFVWDLRLDPEGEGTSVEVYRARVRNRDHLHYAQVQDAVGRGVADERLRLLKEVGERRIALERARGGASLPALEEQVSVDQDGRYAVALRPPLAAQDWAAQISLMVGIAAAELMLHADVGILRTLPEPDHHVVRRFRRQARALGVTWPAEMSYGELLRSLDRADPGHVALMHEAASLFSDAGAGYSFFEGGVPERAVHAAVMAPYAHVCAPLDRLVDRFALVVCESICRDVPVPDWVRQSSPVLPEIMTAADRLVCDVERACADAVTAATLRHRVGETFRGSVVDVTTSGALVQLRRPMILAPVEGECHAGDEVGVRLVAADVGRRSVRFEVAGGMR